ncbi:hypothetical protein [Enterobacter cloacae complex sp. GF14B]|uniref:hypothetical protein n=1 Tax=Enterobacter cloacae complex sp. GF14B TaxID=2511982 RepID=UPI00100FD246|nr:hypothetical protein [Enterobacter cloacae complex sp. GF14B]RYA38459.1 hypothetical protein DD606_25975 [Enterobacter cloacae complex sp. GF14B]
MSIPIQCTLNLGELLKIRPYLWNDIQKTLEKVVITGLITKNLGKLKHKLDNKEIRSIPMNKVGEYYEGEEGNTTLPVRYNDVETMAILDSWAGIAIATKVVCESWGKSTIIQTRMKLQLDDRHIEKLLGLLEKVIVSSCGIDHQYNFSIVDFGKRLNYEIILGRPFM